MSRIYSPPIVGSLFSWKSLLTNRNTREDLVRVSEDILHHNESIKNILVNDTFPTAASPSSTSLTLLLGFGALSAMSVG